MVEMAAFLPFCAVSMLIAMGALVGAGLLRPREAWNSLVEAMGAYVRAFEQIGQGIVRIIRLLAPRRQLSLDERLERIARLWSTDPRESFEHLLQLEHVVDVVLADRWCSCSICVGWMCDHGDDLLPEPGSRGRPQTAPDDGEWSRQPKHSIWNQVHAAKAVEHQVAAKACSCSSNRVCSYCKAAAYIFPRPTMVGDKITCPECGGNGHEAGDRRRERACLKCRASGHVVAH